MASPPLRAVDPETGVEVGPSYRQATVADVQRSADQAAAAFESSLLGEWPARAAMLRNAGDRLRAHSSEIVSLAMTETGLPEVRLRSELERTCLQLESFASLLDEGDYVEAIIDLADSQAKPIPRPDLRRMLVPIGPVAVFGASNFPLAFSTAGGDTASALAAGCPVLVKGHPSHPGTGERVARELLAAVSDVGLPLGTFAHLLSSEVEIGEALVDHPAIAAVAFTGSSEAGRAIFDRAARRRVPVPAYAEMGSINPVIVSEAALQARGETIAETLAASITASGGQLCTKPGVVFTPATPAGDSFAAEIARLFDALPPTVMLNGRLHDALRASLKRLEALPAVELLTCGTAVGGPGFRHPAALYQARADAIRESPELLEEHFGPIAILLRYGSDRELLEALPLLEGQLTATLHVQGEADRGLVDTLLPTLTACAGRLLFAGVPTGVAVTHAMLHGGPYPATTAPAHTSVGTSAIRRFLRPVVLQDAPAEILPPALRDENPLRIWRRIDGELSRDPIEM